MGDNHPVVTPQPIPTTFNVTQVQASNGAIFAQLTMHSLTGVYVTFLDPEVSKAVGEALMKIGEVSATGLLMP